MTDKSAGTQAEANKPMILKLYIVEGSPNSMRAVANLSEFCRKQLDDRCEIEIIDISKNPIPAMEAGILVSPTLVKLLPLPAVKTIGDLSDMDLILYTLGMKGRT